MTDIIGTWIIGIVGTSLVTCIISSIAPKGKSRNMCRFIGGLLMLIAVLKPLINIEAGGMAKVVASLKTESGIYTANLEEENFKMFKEIIAEDTAAYILDKAEKLGVVQCEVSVSTKKEEDGYPYPYEIWVSAFMSEVQKAELSVCIETDLGISADKQHWSIKNGY